jgi:hypothetical protein
VKTISGRIALSAAADIGFVGIIARRNSENGGTALAGFADDNAPRNASPAPLGIGNAARSMGITTAAIAADDHRITIIVMIARIVIRPARAILAACVTPTINSDTTNGMIVICKAFSHIVPIKFADASNHGTLPAVIIPVSSPKISDAKMIKALRMIIPVNLTVSFNRYSASLFWQAIDKNLHFGR